MSFALRFAAVVAALLACAVLGMAVSRSTASGPGLIAVLALLHFVPASTNVAEAVLFDVLGIAAAPVALLRHLVVSVIVAVALAWVFGRFREAQATSLALAPVHSAPGLLWPLAAIAAVFTLCYFAAGMVIYPLVKDYYQVRVMPAPGSIAAMQVLRSLALLAAVYPLLRTIPSRRAAQWTLALLLPVLGGIVPLLPENELMPGWVRLVHGVEISSYYGLFVYLLATWFGAPPQWREPAPNVDPAVSRA
jgi:hypothetical protein